MNRIKTKRGYKYIAIILAFFGLFQLNQYYVENIYTIGLVQDGYIVATKKNKEIKMLEFSTKLTSRNLVNFDKIEEYKEIDEKDWKKGRILGCYELNI